DTPRISCDLFLGFRNRLGDGVDFPYLTHGMAPFSLCQRLVLDGPQRRSRPQKSFADGTPALMNLRLRRMEDACRRV
ncbi:hypothetical protein, partial [Pseudomonas sp. EA_65y_Pfl1_P113]|uniref:hypothetical protein n=1 Tax=Pseudomonas sp. EA_65y_Pfl1_P113 TaxID=3088692 RepID=UPI0030DD6F83